MSTKLVLVAFMAFALAMEALAADSTQIEQMEDSTESPIVDLTIVDTENKAPTERPPTAAAPKNASMAAAKSEPKPNSQPHTVADFIIHPLIAFKPRTPEDSFAGKQAGDSTSTPSPWSIFGFNAGQGLGSSVTSLAGSVSGWLNNRIQLPGLVESPIRDPAATNTSTTTTTTQRPDVVVRVQHKASTRRPLISINNNRNRPQNFQNNNNNFDSDEYDDEYEEESPRPQQNHAAAQKRRRRPFVEDDISEAEEEEEDDDEHENDAESDENNDVDHQTIQRPNKRRLVAQNNNKRRRLQQQQQQQWRPYYAGNQRRRLQKPALNDDDDDDDDDEEDDDEDEVQFYYGSRPSTKRSQTEAGFFQRGQDNIINQLRQLTRGYTPAEIGALVGGNKKKQRQQTTLLVNRNGQTIYLAPELLNVDLPLVNTQIHHVSQISAQAPEPPLSVPLKRKNAPTQYITIPWAQLGISPPEQLHSVTEGVQSQPLILKKKPVLTAEAVPLLAEASIVDVFKPPTFPNDRHTAAKPSSTGNPVIIATKKQTSSGAMASKSSVLPQRIRPGTIVEKAPASAESQQEGAEDMSTSETVRKQYILVGADTDPGLGRQVQSVYATKASPYVGLLRVGQFPARRNGRELDTPALVKEEQGVKQMPNGEQLIPVQIINEPEMVEQSKKTQYMLPDTHQQKDTPAAQQKEVAHEAIEDSSAPEHKAASA